MLSLLVWVLSRLAGRLLDIAFEFLFRVAREPANGFIRVAL